MESHINFDTLEYLEELKRGGIHHLEAEAITKATSKAFMQMMIAKDLATKKDLIDLKTDLQNFIVKAVSTTIVILGSIQTCIHYLN